MNLLEVRDLSVTLTTAQGRLAALSDVSLAIAAGEVVGLVGESGGGKTMLARAIVRLLPPGAAVSGSIDFDGEDVLAMAGERLREHRGRGVAMCFQQSSGALNPVRRIGAQVADRLEAHEGLTKRDAAARAVELLDAVGIRDAARRARAFPHELSGGMRQRVMIALSIACRPRLLLADEPTTGLDATLTRDVLALLRAEATERNSGVLLVSHDIASIAEVVDRVVVLYAGTVVEDGPAEAVINHAVHPYTRALIDAVPDLFSGPGRQLPGRQPTLAAAPLACPFAQRCELQVDRCTAERPGLALAGDDHLAACFVTADAPAMEAGDGRRPRTEGILEVPG